MVTIHMITISWWLELQMMIAVVGDDDCGEDNDNGDGEDGDALVSPEIGD